MIQAKDLRTGNWVLYDRALANNIGDYILTKHEITPIDIDHIQRGFIIVEGIPLTPEILEKAGIIATYSKETNEQFNYRAKGTDFLTKSLELVWFGTKINYLHELQNAYCTIFKEELEVHP